MAFTLTVVTEGGVAAAGSRGFVGSRILRLRPTTEGNLSSAARFEYDMGGESEPITYAVSETYSAVLAAATADMAANGAEILTNKATTFGTVNDTLYPSTEAVVENFAGRHYYAATTASANTYTATLVPATTPFAGMELRVKFADTNTGAATLNAAPIKKGTGGATALSSSDLVTTKIYTLIYDGTNWQINL